MAPCTLSSMSLEKGPGVTRAACMRSIMPTPRMTALGLRRAVKAQTFAEAERLGAALGARLAEALKNAAGFSAGLSLAATSAAIE